MLALHRFLFGAGGLTNVWPYTIENSALFNGADYLTFTPAAAQERRRWTLAFSVKIAGFVGDQTILATDSSSEGYILLSDGEGAYKLYVYLGGTSGWARAVGLQCDTTNHLHCVIVCDTTHADPTKRLRFFVNGKEQETTSPNWPALDVQGVFGGGATHYIGRRDSGTWPLGSYLSNFHFIVGQALTPDSFGEWSSVVSGLWVPKAYTGDYGTNGSHLDFADAANLGKDVSGNGNDWTVNGAPIQTVDTPTNNYCTLNPHDPATTGVLSDGNLTTTGDATITIRPEHGQWYYEKDGVGISYDADTNGQFDPVLTSGTYNFGATAWSDTGPTGTEKPLCAANLVEPEPRNPLIGALVNLRAGNGTSDTIDTGFAPDLVISKCRSTAGDWLWYDSVRGATKELNSNNTDAEVTNTNGLTSFTGSGFSIGSAAAINSSGQDYLDIALKRGPEFGFDIVTWDGDDAIGRPLSHNLSGVPEFITVKKRNTPSIWLTYHKALGQGKYLDLSSSDDAYPLAGIWDTISSTTFAISGNSWNAIGESYVAYVFRSVPGFSKVFSYTGNNSLDGPLVDLGFIPLAMMFKNADGSDDWQFSDSARDPYNPVEWTLRPNENAVEYQYSDRYRYLSNGFKITDNTGGQVNGAGDLYVGIAWAAQPFKYSNAF